MTDKTALNVLIDCCFGGPEQDALREQALAEYAALEADSRRLEWRNNHPEWHIDCCEGEWYAERHSACSEHDNSLILEGYETANAAIDAAMEEATDA